MKPKSNARKDETDTLLLKMAATIATSGIEHKQIVERYLSLANSRLSTLLLESEDWRIVAYTLILEKEFEAKFGIFSPRDQPVRLGQGRSL